TRGVVSGFRFDDQLNPHRRTAILTDAAVSAGSSGGTAINARGELIGIVLAATHLDCDPSTDSGARGCLPSGGSVTKLLPSTLVRDYLAGLGLADRLPSRATKATPVSLATLAAAAQARAGTAQPCLPTSGPRESCASSVRRSLVPVTPPLVATLQS